MVDADGGERGDPTDGGDLQDVTTALGAQERQRRLRDPECPEQIGLDLLAGLRLAEFLDHAELAVAGVVHHDVEPAEVLVCPGDGCEDGAAIGDVQADREHRVAVGSHEGVQAAGAAGGGDHVVTALQGGKCPLPAEAARCTGDEPGLGAHVLSPDVVGFGFSQVVEVRGSARVSQR